MTCLKFCTCIFRNLTARLLVKQQGSYIQRLGEKVWSVFRHEVNQMGMGMCRTLCKYVSYICYKCNWSLYANIMLELEYPLVPGVVIIPLQIATKWSMIKYELKWVVQCRKQKQFKIHQCFTIIWKNELDLWILIGTLHCWVSDQKYAKTGRNSLKFEWLGYGLWDIS